MSAEPFAKVEKTQYDHCVLLAGRLYPRESEETAKIMAMEINAAFTAGVAPLVRALENIAKTPVDAQTVAAILARDARKALEEFRGKQGAVCLD